MKHVQWDPVKSRRLKMTRGVSFEEIIIAKLVDRKDNPAREFQKMMLFEYRNYIWVVPYVEKDGIVFLKTLYPSRKYTRVYVKKEMI
jgi:hypothetical protein